MQHITLGRLRNRPLGPRDRATRIFPAHNPKQLAHALRSLLSGRGAAAGAWGQGRGEALHWPSQAHALTPAPYTAICAPSGPSTGACTPSGPSHRHMHSLQRPSTGTCMWPVCALADPPSWANRLLLAPRPLIRFPDLISLYVGRPLPASSPSWCRSQLRRDHIV